MHIMHHIMINCEEVANGKGGEGTGIKRGTLSKGIRVPQWSAAGKVTAKGVGKWQYHFYNCT